METTLTSEGKVTIPEHICNFLGLVAGSKVEFVLTEFGEVVVRPASVRMAQAKGALDRFEFVRGRADIKCDIQWRADE